MPTNPSSQPPLPTLTQMLKSQLATLAPSMKQLANHILQHPAEVIHMSTHELAVAAGVADATVTRLSRKVNCSGFPALKIALSAELAVQPQVPTSGHQEMHPVISGTLQDMVSSMYQTRESVDAETTLQVIQKLSHATRIEVVGEGNSQLAAHYLLEKLLKLGLPASSHADPRVIRMHASTLPKDGVMLAFSRSGTTANILEYLRLARQGGACTVMVTHNPEFLKQNLVQYTILLAQDSQPSHAGSVSSFVSQILVAEVLSQGLLNNRSSKLDY